MTKSNFFIIGSICFTAGIFVGNFFSVPQNSMLVAIAVLVGGIGISFVARKRAVTFTALFLLIGVVGIVRFQKSLTPNQFSEVMGKKQQLEGYIVEDIDMRLDKQLVTFQPEGYNQRLLLTVSKYQEYFYGDQIVVEGKITQAKSSPDFDYKKYLQRYNIYGLVYYPKVLVLKTNKQNIVIEKLLRIKYAFAARLGDMFAEPQKSLLLGILIGARKTLPPEVVQNFNNAGTSHIIAISGFNISIIITSLAFLAHVIGRRLSFWLSLMVIVAFVIITGGSASVLRAGVMGMLLLVAFAIGRQYRVSAALFFAAFIMLVQNPSILVTDVGFQLSFIATLGIVYFMPLLQNLTSRWPEIWEFKNIFLATMAAIVSTLPLLLYEFGTLSIVAPIVNILVLPIIPVTMLFGFLSVLPIAGPGFAFLANFLLLYILKTTEFFAQLSFASVPMPIPAWFLCVLVVCIFGLYFVLKQLASKRKPLVEEVVRIW